MERASKQCKRLRLSHPNKVQSRKKKKKNREREIEKLRAAIRVENHRDKELVEVVNCSGLAWKSNSFDIYEKIKDNSNTRDRSRLLLEWLISPISIERFFNEFWEKKALVIKRSDPNYYSHIFSSKEMDEILRKENIQYSVNLDVTEYVDGERRTLNPEGRAYPGVVWKYYEEGCSLRFLNPQTFSNSLWWLNATLQDFFHSFVGANMYLTPPNSQGFAPHYDDIEAFILQIEGEKHWKLHPPRNENEILARESSGNFTDEDLAPPMLKVRLEQGDLLYFPRGFIHQASTVPGTHSLHITLSTYQKNSWGDFLLELLPKAVQNAIARDVEFRKGLPPQHFSYLGQQQQSQTEEQKIQRKEFKVKILKLLENLKKYIDIDHAADKRCINFIHESLPPALTNAESEQSAVGITRWEVSSPHPQVSVDLTSRIRLHRPDSVRLVHENGQSVLYNTAENSRVYLEKPPQSFELENEFVSAIKSLIEAYPTYISVQDIPCHTEASKIDIAEVLFSQNLLEMIEEKLA